MVKFINLTLVKGYCKLTFFIFPFELVISIFVENKPINLRNWYFEKIRVTSSKMDLFGE